MPRRRFGWRRRMPSGDEGRSRRRRKLLGSRDSNRKNSSEEQTKKDSRLKR